MLFGEIYDMKRTSFYLASLIVVLGVAVELAYCEMVTVKADGTGHYATIQDAIDNATAGDEVVLQPGNYTGQGNRDIEFHGKAIIVRGSDPDNWTTVEATIIDCQGNQTDPHRGFYFHDNETATSVLAGMTITNGYGPEEQIWDDESIGGGIFCTSSSPAITSCRIISNQAGYGGGVFLYNSDNSTISNCRITSNYGGGVWCTNSSINISHCTISYNQGEPHYGGGVSLSWK